jgi:hypothetical protein
MPESRDSKEITDRIENLRFLQTLYELELQKLRLRILLIEQKIENEKQKLAPDSELVELYRAECFILEMQCIEIRHGDIGDVKRRIWVLEGYPSQ